ncbi:MAG: FtsX-like permease family protein [Candidatus Bipolaricaulota bacterium]|nr:FtsX-like permease family protein [Candidatus Bipolaricaulota bacterium]
MKAAIRHLKRNRGRTILTLLAVLIPVYFLVFMFGLSNSIVSDMFETATRIDTGHLQIRHIERHGMGSAIPLMHDSESVLADLGQIDGIEWRTVRLDMPALASVADRSQAIYVQGVMPEEIAPISSIGDLVVKGTYLKKGQSGAVIGEELAALLNVDVGGEIVLLGAHPETGLGALKVPVVGIYRAPISAMGRTIIHTTLTTARQLARSPDAATAVVVRVDNVKGPWDVAKIEAVTAQLNSLLPDDLEVLDWRELAPQVSGYMGILQPVMIIFAVIFFGLGALVVLNTLYLSVMERTRELGLIIALGASRWRVIRMILTEAGLIAVIGAVYGAVIGVALAWVVEAFGGIPLPGADLADYMKVVGMKPVLHMMISWPQVVISAVAMVGVAVLAAWFPAYRASKLEPVEAMRYVE